MPASTPPASDSSSQTIDRTERRAARLVAAAIRAGRRSANDAFDRFLGTELREVSDQYWTPLQVVRRAADWLRETRVPTVVDIGSGAGKFCVGAALLTRCHYIGVEHRPALVSSARALAATFEVENRVTFIHGNLDAAAPLNGNAFYLFNPFGGYDFGASRFSDPGVEFSPATRSRDIHATAALLAAAPAGTYVITYNGFGGRMPATYEQLEVALNMPGTLRLWKQRVTVLPASLTRRRTG